MSWYSLFVYQGQELAVQRAIKKRIEENVVDIKTVLVPTRKIKQKNRKKEIVIKEEPIYKSYLFLEIEKYDSNIWQKIRDIHGILKFIGSQDSPQEMNEKDLKNIIQLEKEEKVAVFKKSFDIDSLVRINSGAFENFEGKIKTYNPETRMLEVNLSIFGRNTPVEIHENEVSIID